jgi:16S rRNA C967 or C1407 C5-methylase (RsmB/RsmF family)
MQDPGAMAPLSAIKIPRGAKVVDLCAAPGGKSSQAAAMIGEEGFILSNELFPKRAKNALYNAIRIRICGVSTLKNITRGYTVA